MKKPVVGAPAFEFPTVAFIRKTAELDDSELADIIDALRLQLESHFAPAWGYSANLKLAEEPGTTDWQIVFLDDANAAGRMGYHGLDLGGKPVAKVFVKSAIRSGEKISVAASHELLEMLIDPSAQLWAQGNDGLFYAYEVCDAVEEEIYPIGEKKLEVSNFVYPAFFESWHADNSVNFDQLKRVTRPFQTLGTGYQVVSDGKSVGEIFGSASKEWRFRTLEDRTFHRSQYRLMRTLTGARGMVSPFPSGYTVPPDYTQRVRGMVSPFGPDYNIPPDYTNSQGGAPPPNAGFYQPPRYKP
jgi:hypothetical protein